MQAEQQRSNSQKLDTSLSLAALIADITDKARNKDKNTEGGSTLYSGRTDKKKLYNKSKNNSLKDKKERKGKLYKNYKDLNTYYELEKYFVTNKKLRTVQEEKHNRKFVPYQLKKKEASSNKTKDKSDDNESERLFADVLAIATCLLRLKLFNEGTLFNTSTNYYFVILTNDFDDRTYTLTSAL